MHIFFLILRIVFLAGAAIIGALALVGSLTDQGNAEQMATIHIWAVCAVGLAVAAAACREPRQPREPVHSPPPVPPASAPPAWGPGGAGQAR